MPLPGFRRIRTWTPEIEMIERDDGALIVSQKGELGSYPVAITDKLVEWARRAPDRTWLARRRPDGAWQRASYGSALSSIRRLGQGLLDLDLSVERPLVILSENAIEHALLATAAQHVGIPSAAISTAFSLVSQDGEKLKSVRDQLTPGAIFVQDGTRYARAVEAVFEPDIPLICVANPVAGRDCIAYSDLESTPATGAVDSAHAAIDGDTVAKFLFTSGTTGSPKAVIQTNRMICANQAMVVDCYAFMEDEPPVVVDWAPWSHTASGNKVFYMVLYNGGTYYIDDGKPSPQAMAETIRNLREIAPTWYFNVPAGYAMLIDAMRTDTALRDNFYSRLRMIMYAGAGMAQHTWDGLEELAIASMGERVLIAAGLGATETGPFQIMCVEEQTAPGNIGVPARGVTLKLVPTEGKLEARVRSPSVTPGYWRNPELTEAAFDEEGFYRLGDALRFAVPGDPAGGFVFDGRLAENFKLETGTWVAVGAVRAALIDDLGGLVADAAIAGENRPFLGAILFPDLAAVRAFLGKDGPAETLLGDPRLRDEIAARLARHAARASGSASRVTRVLLAAVPPSLDKGEITDKGSINQRAVLRHRPELVEMLYSDSADAISAAR